MAQMASGNDGSRTYSTYTRTETYTFEEAIQKAINGSLDPSEIYRQGQPQLKKVVDSLSEQVFSKKFSELSNAQQREIMKKLLSEVEKEKEQSNKPLTILDALKMAKDGLIDDLELYQSLPDELREVLDTISMSYNAINFKAANPKLRKEITGFIIDMLAKSIDEDSRQRTQKEAEQQIQNEAKLKNERAVKLREANEAKLREEKAAIIKKEEEAKLREEAAAKLKKEKEAKLKEEAAVKFKKEEEAKLKNITELNRRIAKQCIICGKSLGFIDKLRHRESHSECKILQG
ncbi:MAG: hypothetical protein NT004_07875 [Bacteroidetes bacterium]|nr:hypothetical protein [Bacteroidota bacterium]